MKLGTWLRLGATLALAACATPGPRQPEPLVRFLPNCSEVRRTASTNELAPDLTRDGYTATNRRDVACMDGNTERTIRLTTWTKTSATDLKMQAEIDKLLPGRFTRPAAAAPAPAHVVRAPIQLHALSRWEKRDALNHMNLDQIASVFERDDRSFLAQPADVLVRHYEVASGMNFGGTGKRFAEWLRHSRAVMQPATAEFLKAHPLSGWRDGPKGVEFRNVALTTQKQRETPDPGEKVIYIDGKPILMTGCLNAPLEKDQQLPDDKPTS